MLLNFSVPIFLPKAEGVRGGVWWQKDVGKKMGIREGKMLLNFSVPIFLPKAEGVRGGGEVAEKWGQKDGGCDLFEGRF